MKSPGPDSQIWKLASRLAGLPVIRKIVEPKLFIWKMRGKPLPAPPKIKQGIVRSYLKDFGLDTLIETGTYRGDMIKALEADVSQVFSVELDGKLQKRAVRRFRRNSGIRILQGDSSELLPKIIKEARGPALFWLDAHYSGGLTAKGDVETPILRELAIVLGRDNPGDVILIDDAREFVGKNDYPTIDQLKDFVSSVSPKSALTVAMDIIRIVRVPV
ncbi:MAG TPA: hypothetical protein VND22_02590 [Actinomycetota bacterium]|nr:hypothetical protein [Actinomycetota bacterium]